MKTIQKILYIHIHKYKYIICILITLSILFLLIYLYFRKIEGFTSNENSIVSNWDAGSGFYSELLFKLNHYIYCKKYQINYKTANINWPYTFKDGWTDYFEDVELKFDRNNITNPNTKTIGGCCTILEQFPLKDYRTSILEYYKYNTKTQDYINDIKNKLQLIDREYGSIYIRRGDKLVDEIKFIPAAKFADLLLEKYPDCNTIFVQTDDYNSYLDIKKHVHDILQKQHIKIITLCPENAFGAIANSNYVNRMKGNEINTLKEDSETLTENKEYVNKIKNNLAKPISEMNNEEKYNHTMELLTSVDICIHSKICICDYKSNVSRFIKIAHNNFNDVYDINNTDIKINLDSKLCPAFDFDSIHQNI